MASTIADLVRVMNTIAPEQMAESWDNVGLLVGSHADALTGPVMLTIDLTGAVVDEAIALKASALIVYHPPIFKPVSRLTDRAPVHGALLRAVRAGMAIYSPHTALDAAPGALCDWLSDAVLGLNPQSTGRPEASRNAGADRRALTPGRVISPTAEVKIVTFVPAVDAERVRNALASAGAGRIGNYSVCSFSTPGEGTFLGNADSAPRVGHAQHLETVGELRLEMVCSRHALALALETLRQFHPYETPAIDVIPLEPQPVRSSGTGRRLVLDAPATLSELASRLRSTLAIPHVAIAPAIGRAADSPIRVVGVCPGSGGELAQSALSEGCDAFVTGEMRHHDALAMTQQGLSLILAGHTNTERGYLPLLAERLGSALPAARFVVSKADRDPVLPL